MRGDELRSVGADGARPVARITTYLGPQGSATATVRFTMPAGDDGPLVVRTTPMVNATQVSVEPGSCR